MIRPHDQRVVVDSASHSQAGWLTFYTNHLHLAAELDITLTLVEALPRDREDTLKCVTQIDGPTDQTVESSTAQILSFTLEQQSRTPPV
jgi:hypothetical protein